MKLRRQVQALRLFAAQNSSEQHAFCILLLVIWMHAYLPCYFSQILVDTGHGCRNLNLGEIQKNRHCNGGHCAQYILRPATPQPPYGEPPWSLYSLEAINIFWRRLARSPFNRRPLGRTDGIILLRGTSAAFQSQTKLVEKRVHQWELMIEWRNTKLAPWHLYLTPDWGIRPQHIGIIKE